MKRITDKHVLQIISGGVNWHEFAAGFCSGFALGTLFVGNVKTIPRAIALYYGIDKGCDGIGWLL